jgi:hypothetical protein
MLEQILVVVLFALLLAISAGVLYITWSEFRDRRRRKRQSAAPPPPPAQAARASAKKRRRP